MNRKKSFGHLLVTYTILLLLPVVAVGLFLIFFCLGKLEKNFEELNTKTIETACTQLDMQIEDILAIDYQLSLNTEVHSALSSHHRPPFADYNPVIAGRCAYGLS